MATDLGQNFGTLSTVAGLAAISAGGTDDATEIDLSGSGNAALALYIEAEMATGTGTPDGNKLAVIYFRWGGETSQPDSVDNLWHVETLNVPTASTTERKTFRIPVIAPYLTIRVKNDQVAGPSITPTIKYGLVHGNQA